MTWFKSLIMRQNSPLLLIDSYSLESETSSADGDQDKSLKVINRHNKQAPKVRYPTNSVRFEETFAYSDLKVSDWKPQEVEFEAKLEREEEQKSFEVVGGEKIRQQQVCRLPPLVLSENNSRQVERPTPKTSCQDTERETNPSSKVSRSKESSISLGARTSQRKQMGSKFCNRHYFVGNGRRAMRATLSQEKSPNWLRQLTLQVALLSLAVASIQAAVASSSGQYFEVQPEAQYLVQNGHDVRLRCLVRNRQGECLWLRNGRAVGTIARKYQFTRQPEDGDCSLMIRNVSVVQDDGQWQCQVTSPDVDQETLQSREVSLVVLVAPERPQIKNVSQATQRLVLEENKSKFIVCEIRGGNPAPQIEWMLDNRSLSKEAQSSSFLNQQANSQPSQRITQSKLKMSDIKRTMNGKNLTCVGVHQTMNQSASVELDVQYVPTVSVGQREYSIVEGSPLSISCQVDANPPPNIVNWRLVNDGSAAQTRGAITLPSRPGAVLEFERISRDLNQNTFECLAQNSYGISLPADVKLNVLYAPFLINTSHSESVALGSQAQLACLFDGNPEPEVKWHYTDPLSRLAAPVQLENNKQQYLLIRNVTYRNEGDYHCEARNQINGVFYGVRSSNIVLDVFGEPQFLVKSPVHAKAVQGNRAELALTFCSDPAPNKVYWQFGSLRLDVRLNNVNNGQQPTPAMQALPGGSPKQSAVSQRFQVHPLQPLQKRESGFSKVPTCFEAQLTILDPELTDQRDYTLIVQNERGHQSAVVRLRVASPLSPVLMISSAFVTICGLFLCSLVVMFVLKRRHQSSGGHSGSNSGATTTLNGAQNGISANGNSPMAREKNGVEHLVNGNANALAAAAAAAVANGQLLHQQTRGLVNGLGNGVANGASNPIGVDEAKLHMLSMASSDTSGDQKQLLANLSDRNSSASGSTNNQCVGSPNSSSQSTAHSTPSPMNHISVDDELNHQAGISTYRAGESITRDCQLSPQSMHHMGGESALIYANLEYTDHNSLGAGSSVGASNQNNSLQPVPMSTPNPTSSVGNQQHKQQQRHQMEHSPNGSNYTDQSSSMIPSPQLSTKQQHQLAQGHHHPSQQSPKGGVRSSVGATIAMMNSLAAAAASQSGTVSPNSGVLNGAINQQLANSRQIKKPGPPKPPKPSIQQRSRFYQQQQQQQQGGLVMIGSQAPDQMGYHMQSDSEPSANELAVEYSRIAFQARAEL